MITGSIYTERRKRLARDVGQGMILFLGNDESAINYRDNRYPFRQDSSFLYFWGLDFPGLSAVIDIDEGRETVYGDDPTLEQTVWIGIQQTLQEVCAAHRIGRVAATDRLQQDIAGALSAGRSIHFLPQYRSRGVLRIHRLFNMAPQEVPQRVSHELIQGIITQRSIKTAEEIAEIESALEITRGMHILAMQLSRPGVHEFDVLGAMESAAYSRGGNRMCYAPVFTIKGEVLHNPFHGNRMKAGDWVLNDSGAESPLHYASDITRTFPVNGRFSEQQEALYRIVLSAQEAAMRAMKPGVEFRAVHMDACKVLAGGLRELGLMKGDVEEAVHAGAHALFFPHGLGHMMGLDVHDMESLGEDHVGYTPDIRRSQQFGLSNLRLARALQPGFVLTVEPGLYFIPGLIERWRAAKRWDGFIDYEKLEAFKNAGGVRIEDDVLITEAGSRVLGPPIPKTVEDVEAVFS